MSWPLSFVEAPDYLDGALAGDAGFDPIGVVPLFSMLAAPFSGIVSTNSNRGRSSTFDREEAREVVYTLREAEIKHARIAMLAALGWPVSELYHYQLSQKIGTSHSKQCIALKIFY